MSSRLREHKLLVPGSATAGCCRAGRVLMTHFSHVCLDVGLHVCLDAWMDVYVCMCVCVCVCLFSLCSVRVRLRVRSGELLSFDTVFLLIEKQTPLLLSVITVSFFRVIYPTEAPHVQRISTAPTRASQIARRSSAEAWNVVTS